MSNLAKRKKPRKPYESFPLTAHNNGQWCKKIRGQVYFFGVWAGPEAALDNYLRVAADLHAGRKPLESTLPSGEMTVKDITNQYLTYQAHRVENHEITPRWLDDCLRTLEHFVKFVGATRVVSDVRPEDFQNYRQYLVQHGLTGKKGLGVYALDRSVVVVKAMFEYAYQAGILSVPIRYGTMFKQSSIASKRKLKAILEIKNGKRLFEPPELRTLVSSASPTLRAMILLGINGGFGSTDCARLPMTAVKLDKRMIEFPRPKTGVERVVPLWPETHDAIQEALTKRSEAASTEEAGLIFLTTSGHAWVRYTIHMSPDAQPQRVVRIDAIGQEFNKLLKKLGLKRRGLGFYALRHTFRTWADEVRDQHAIHRIMGHAIPGMSGIYVERIELNRLRAVVDHVRAKLFQGSIPTPGVPDNSTSST